ncbi:cupin domain-containing protein [archaeon]|nr:cupin domain-containing protein [archaeon]
MDVIRNSEGKWIEGKGKLSYRKKVRMDNIPAAINLIQDVILFPGEKILPHMHKHTAEIFYITKGKTKMNVSGNLLELGPKDMVFIEVGEEHSFSKESDKNLEMIVFKINFKKDDALLYE